MKRYYLNMPGGGRRESGNAAVPPVGRARQETEKSPNGPIAAIFLAMAGSFRLFIFKK
jgi:hypothetical protein